MMFKDGSYVKPVKAFASMRDRNGGVIDILSGEDGTERWDIHTTKQHERCIEVVILVPAVGRDAHEIWNKMCAIDNIHALRMGYAVPTSAVKPQIEGKSE